MDQLTMFDVQAEPQAKPNRPAPASQATLWQAASVDLTSPAHDQVLAGGAVPAWAAAILFQYQLSANARRQVCEDLGTGRITTARALRARCRALQQAE